MLSLIIADDESDILEGLKSVVKWETLGYAIAGIYGDGESVVRHFEQHGPVDVLLTDIRMTGMSGLDLALYVSEHELPTKIILLSGYSEFELAQKAVEYHVYRYILKPSDISELEAVFTDLRRQLEDSADPVQDENMVIRIVKDYVDSVMPGNPSLSDVAEKVYLNTSYLSHLFKEKTGETFTIYVTQKRIEYAKSLLRDPKNKVYMIADMMGYRDLSYFHKTFKKHTGLTPREFRDKEAVPDYE